jgi:hypothetical protein
MLSAQTYETLGALYLGRPVDRPDTPLLYDSSDLTTHAAILGMTGSGKTGLGIALLEECAIDGIPALIIDPKGDLANLALTFPTQSAEEFAPWCDDATTATATAKRWREGLAAWGQDPARVAKLRAAAEVAVYTPGSTAGRPLALLGSFAAPVDADAESTQTRLDALVGGLLGLVGLGGDPLASREHILIAAIISRVWAAGEDLDLAGLIGRVQDPGFTKLGVMDLATVFPPKDRLALALRLNQLAASPAFAAWSAGEALDIASLLHTPEGRPRLAVISIAHLDDAQRMFTVTLILAQLLAWMRAQPGTPSLRAVLYMDEIAGYLPPVANPPSKPALMTLLKQARAFGVGVVLASQNPADLDYKALANIGTWWIGRLQTERDRQKVLQAFEGDPQRDRIAAILPGLGNRVFLQRNVHESAAIRIEVRWTLSYLRGPLTRDDLRRLALPRAVAVAAPVESVARRPVLPADVPQWFVPLRGAVSSSTPVTYQPRILGSAQIAFADSKSGLRELREVLLLAELSDAAVAVDWFTATPAEVAEADLERTGQRGARFAELPVAVTAKDLTAWSRSFADALYRTQSLVLFSSANGGVSKPGESEAAFRIRLGEEGRAARDAATAALRARYAPKLAALEERLRRARAAAEKEREQASAATWDGALSIGASLLGAFLGRKVVSATNAGRLASGARAVGRSMRERGDVARATDTVEAVEAQLRALAEEFDAEAAALEQRSDPRLEVFGLQTLVPRKSDITVRFVAVAWVG